MLSSTDLHNQDEPRSNQSQDKSDTRESNRLKKNETPYVPVFVKTRQTLLVQKRRTFPTWHAVSGLSPVIMVTCAKTQDLRLIYFRSVVFVHFIEFIRKVLL